jgi:hypothetical protein
LISVNTFSEPSNDSVADEPYSPADLPGGIRSRLIDNVRVTLLMRFLERSAPVSAGR